MSHGMWEGFHSEYGGGPTLKWKIPRVSDRVAGVELMMPYGDTERSKEIPNRRGI